jgi:DNA polymerase III subunit epsilon
MNPGISVPYFITRLTGISQSMVSEAKPSGTVMQEAYQFINGLPLVAHNASFDRSVLVAEMARLNRTIDSSFICTMRLGRRLYPFSPDHKLATLARLNNIGTSGHHRALADAVMTAHLLNRMIDELTGLYTGNCIDASFLTKYQATKIASAKSSRKKITSPLVRSTVPTTPIPPTVPSRGTPSESGNAAPLRNPATQYLHETGAILQSNASSTPTSVESKTSGIGAGAVIALLIFFFVVVANLSESGHDGAPIKKNIPIVNAPVVSTPIPRPENNYVKPEPVAQRVKQSGKRLCPEGWSVDINDSGACVFALGTPREARKNGPCDFTGAMSDQDFINCGRTPPR